jgi:hypothetical protein
MSGKRVKSHKVPERGDTVRVQDRWGEWHWGIVIGWTRFNHCPGANQYNIYVPRRNCQVWTGPVVMSTSRYGFEVVSSAGEEVRDRLWAVAWKHYKKHLSQYPKQVEHFEKNPDFICGSWSCYG